MARALYSAPLDPVTSAQLAALTARVRQLEAELAALQAQSALALEVELRHVASERAAIA